jgi:hypothetical protein
MARIVTSGGENIVSRTSATALVVYGMTWNDMVQEMRMDRTKKKKKQRRKSTWTQAFHKGWQGYLELRILSTAKAIAILSAMPHVLYELGLLAEITRQTPLEPS